MVANLNKKINRDSLQIVFFQIAGVLLLVIILVLVLADFRMYKRKQSLKSEVIEYEKKIEDLKKSNGLLKDEIANSGDQDYLEKVAYEQGMLKAGEREVIFVVPAQKTEAAQKPSNWFSNALNWIKSKF